MLGRLRLYSGLVLFTYLVGHLANHALGVISLEAMNAGIPFTIAPWRTLPGTVLLGGAALVHVSIVLWSLYERQTLRTTIQGDYGLGYFEDGKKIGEVYREVA